MPGAWWRVLPLVVILLEVTSASDLPDRCRSSDVHIVPPFASERLSDPRRANNFNCL